MFSVAPLVAIALDTITAELRISTEDPARAQRWAVYDSVGVLVREGRGAASLAIVLGPGGYFVCSAERGKWVSATLIYGSRGELHGEAPCLRASLDRRKVMLEGALEPPARR